MMRSVDLVTTTTETLATKFRLAGAPAVTVVENYLPPEFAHGKRKGHAGLVVGWAGLKEHEADAALLGLAPILRDMLDKFPHVRLATLGLVLDLTHSRYEARPRVPFLQLAEALRDFDIGLAPLAPIPFNAARSNVKIKEYAITGVPWLASKVGPYLGLGYKQGGRLVADDEWTFALHRLIHSRRDRIGLRVSGQLWARKQTVELNIGAWEQAFESAIARRRSSG